MAGFGGSSKNPFFDDDEDVDDDTFLANAPKKPQNGDSRLEQILEEKRRIEERTLQASGRAKGVLVETEKIGITTAEELIRQREQLERTGDRLDNMNNSLRASEKHIQNIKVLKTSQLASLSYFAPITSPVSRAFLAVSRTTSASHRNLHLLQASQQPAITKPQLDRPARHPCPVASRKLSSSRAPSPHLTIHPSTLD